MKKLGKALLGLIAAVAMLFTGLVAPTTALAEGTHTLTINSAEAGHTYEAYQVFSGTLSTDGKTLTNIQWGSGVNGGDILTALQGDKTFGEGNGNAFKDVTTAAGVAEKLSAYKDNSAEAEAFAKIVGKKLSTTVAGTSGTGTKGDDDKYTYEISNLADGYYLVKDKKDTVPSDDAYTDFILKVVKDTEAQPKGEAPTVQKKVKDVNDSDSTQEDNNKWQDSADHDINDKVDYQLTGTLPSNYDSYDTYSYTFTDILSAGLTYDENSAKVYVVNGDQRTDVTNQFTVTGPTEYTPTDETKEAAYLPVKNDKGQVIAQAHKLTIAPTNGDLMKITGATIDKDSKIVVEYTATLNEHAKVGSAGNPNKVDLTYSNNPNGTGEGTLPPDEVIVFTFKLTVNKTDGENPLKGAAFSLYKWNGTAYGDTPVKSYTQQDNLSSFDFSGLDDGRYKLVEDEAPDTTYNKIDSIEFKIVATHTQDGDDPARTLTKLEIKSLDDKDMNDFTIDASKNVSTDVVNKKGSELPETGGIGTTILYVAGAACVIAAGLWFGLRRRNAR